MTKFQEKFIADGYCDKRGVVFSATATKLPLCERGMVTVCLNDNTLKIYHGNMQGLTERLYTVELKDVKKLKIKAGLFHQVLKFEYNGGTFSFTDFFGVKPLLKIIKAEAKKR